MKCDAIRVLISGERLPLCMHEAAIIVTVTVGDVVDIEIPLCEPCASKVVDQPVNLNTRPIPFNFYY